MQYIHHMNARPKPAKYLTVRNLPPRVAEALEAEKRRRNLSLNQTVIELLRSSLGIDVSGSPVNGLRQLAGSWSEPEFADFERALGPTEQVDPDLWT
jgi:hypothetical protein